MLRRGHEITSKRTNLAGSPRLLVCPAKSASRCCSTHAAPSRWRSHGSSTGEKKKRAPESENKHGTKYRVKVQLFMTWESVVIQDKPWRAPHPARTRPWPLCCKGWRHCSPLHCTPGWSVAMLMTWKGARDKIIK